MLPTPSIIPNVRYTLRSIPVALDRVLRQRASASGKSLNEVAIDALAEGAGLVGAFRKRRNLSDIAGTWKVDESFDDAFAAQDRADENFGCRS